MGVCGMKGGIQGRSREDPQIHGSTVFGSVRGEGNEGRRLRSEDEDSQESLGYSREMTRVSEHEERKHNTNTCCKGQLGWPPAAPRNPSGLP